MVRHLRSDKEIFMMQVVALFIVLIGLTAHIAEAQPGQFKVVYKKIPDNRGTEFVIGFMQQFQKEMDGAVRLFLTSDYNTRAVIEIPAVNFRTTLEIKARQLHSYDVANTLRMRGTKVERKGIYIRADNEIVVYGLNIKNFTTDAFLALPVDIQSTKYIIPSFTPSQYSLIAIIGIHDKTTVFVTFRFAKKSSSFRFRGRRYRHRDTLSITLSRLQSLQIAHSSDMTGTKIYSTKPISVFSGNECANVPEEFGYCDHLVEHIPPVNTWGTRFITAPLRGRTGGDFFRILASKDNTWVKVNGRYVKKINLGRYVELNVRSDQYQFIETSNPCLLLQYSKGSKVDNTRTDPFMVMIPPVEQYTAQYTVSTPDQLEQYFDSYINVIIDTKQIDGLRLDGRTLRDEKWTPVWGTNHSAAQLSVSHGVHRVMHDSPIVPFAIFLYGFSRADSYGYPGGLRLADLTLECVPGNPGDGLDNDCDRRIDEEIKNYIDDDNDGRIDEDLVTDPPKFVLGAQVVELNGCPSDVKTKIKEPTIISAPLCSSRGSNKLSFVDQFVERKCIQYIDRLWLVKDGCGNLANVTQEIRIKRPEIEVSFPADVTGQCGQAGDVNVTGKPEIVSSCKEDVFSIRYRDSPALEECTLRGREVKRRWRVKASCGSVLKQTQRFLPDITPPKISFTGKLQYRVKRDFEINWVANEQSTFQCSVDDPNNPRPCGKGTEGTWSKRDIPDGKHIFYVRAIDNAGNIGGFIRHHFDVDKTRPRLRFKRPLATLSRDELTVAWESTEMSRFKCGTTVQRMEICGSGLNAKKNLRNLPDGTYNFYVGARDQIGNEAEIIKHTFTIDSTPPRIKFGASLPPNVNSTVDLPILANEYSRFLCSFDDAKDYKPCGEGMKGRFAAKNLIEGPHVLYVKAVDPAGNVAKPILLSWNSDKTSPNILFTPGLPTKFREKPDITWSSSEYAKFHCALNDLGLLAPCGEGSEGRWSKTIPHGSHSFFVRGTDKNGNVGPLATFKFVIDNKAPVVRLKSPLPRKSSSKTMTYRWTSNEMAYYECAVDGLANAQPCGSGNDGEWTTPPLTDGKHVFYLIAKDEVGNKARPLQHSWDIDSVSPTLRFVGKLPDDTNSKTQKFKWISPEYATFLCSVDSATEFKRCGRGRNGETLARNLGDGPHTFRVKAVDRHDNEGPVLKHTWTIDTKTPSVTLAEVPKTINKPQAKFKWDSTEPSKFRCSVDDDTTGVPCGSGTKGEYLTPTLADGPHEFRLLTEDMVGNLAPLIRAKFETDTTAPVITMNKRNPDKPQGKIAVSWRSSEEAEFECAVDDTSNYEKCGSGSRGVFQKDDLPDGEHKLYVRGTDKVGNVGKPTVFTVTTDKTAPTLKFTNQLKPLSRKMSEEFTWSSDERARFLCQYDDRSERYCGEGNYGRYTTPSLPDGEHVFRVTPIDQVGNRGTPLERKWKIDSASPVIRYTNQPPEVSGDRVTFRWTSSESATFECVLDDASKPQACGSGRSGEKVLSKLPTGDRVFRVRGTDEAGNVGSFVPHRWKVDTNPPTIKFTGDLPSFSTDTLTLKWTSDERSSFECALDNPANFSRCGSGTRGSWTKSGLPEGRRTFYVRAKDRLNNVGEPISHSWTVDSTPPIAFLNPVRPFTSSAVTTLSWRTNEKSKFYCAIGDVGNVIDCGQGTTGSWSTPYLRRGPQKFWLIAEDYTGNRAEPVIAQWTVDNDAPTVTFSPNSTKTSSTNRPKFSWISDEQATFFCAVEGLTQFRACGDGTRGTFTATDIPDGRHTFLVRARDRFGNEKPPARFPFEIDTTPPTGFSVTVPPRRTNKRQATFKWRTSEDAKFNCFLDNQVNSSECGSGVNGQFTTGPLPDGDHTFKVVATDDLGNKAPVVNRKWTVDTAGPVITFPKDLPKTTLDSPRFTFTANERATFECSLDDASTWQNCGSGDFGSWQGVNLPDGKHSFFVRGKDDLNNVGKPNVHRFNVDHEAPEIKITKPPDATSSKPVIKWSSSEDVTFECSVDNGAFAPCGTGKTGARKLKDLDDGTHKFTVQGKDAIGNTGRHTYTWKIDTTPPTAELTGNLPTDTNRRLITLSWKSDETARFTCSVTTGNVTSKTESCGVGLYGQYSTPVLPDGNHTFMLTSVDVYGNKGPVVKHTWKQDSSPPKVKVNPDTSVFNTSNPSFTWTSSEDATFECAVDNTALYEDCGQGTDGKFTAKDVPSGRHMFFIRGKDTSNNYGPHVQYPFRVDTNAPRVYLNNGVPSKTKKPRLRVSWTASEESNFECILDGRRVNCGSGRRGKYTSPKLPDGQHRFSVTPVDDVGNKGTPTVINWETDSTPPEIQFSPDLPKKTNSKPRIRWTSSEPANYECALDSKFQRVPCRSGPLGQWDGNNIPRGPHTFFVRAIDSVKNVGNWKSFSFEVDTRGPVISFPKDQPRVTKRNPTLTWTSSEFAKFYCGVDTYSLDKCGEGTSGQWTGKDVNDGTHLFLIYGVDDMNNRGPYAQHLFTVDNSAPQVYFPGPLPDKTGPSPRFRWSSTEDARFECSLDDGDYENCGSGFNGIWTKQNIPDGQHVFSVRGRDKNGNVGQPTRHTFTVDKTGPKVTIREPFPTKTPYPVSMVQWKSDEVAKFECAVDDVEKRKPCGYGNQGQYVTPRLPDGEHTFYVVAEDRFGNKGPVVSRKWLIDSKPPVVKVNPATSVFNTRNPSFTWTSSEDATFECAVDDTRLYKDCGRGTNGKFTAKDVPSGRHMFFIRGKDTANNYGPHVQYPFKVDTEPTQIYFTSRPPSKSRSPKVNFRWTSSEDSNYECMLDGKSVNCGSGTRGSYTTPRLPDGNHNFSVNTVDSVGNKGTSTVITWDTDANPPVVKVNPDISVYNTSNPSFTWTSSENATFECAIDDTRLYEDCGQGTRGKFTAKDVPSGTHAFFIRGKDDHNNYGPHVQYIFKVDTTPPQVFLNTRIPSQTRQSRLQLRWTASENSTFECILDGKPFDCKSGRRGRFTTPRLPNGRHTFTLNAVDNVGNKGRPVTVSWETDTEPTQIYFTSRPPSKSRSPRVNFRWTSSEDSNYECMLDGKSVNCGSGTRGSYTTPRLPDGNHNFSVNTVDSVGNKGTSTVITWDTDANPPVVKVNPDIPVYNTSNPSFTWTSSENATFECAIDDTRLYEDCGQGTRGKFTAKDVPSGTHAFFIRGKDDHNNYGPHVQYIFRVDTTPPQVFLNTRIPSQTRQSRLRLRWTVSENSTFECILDGKPFDCKSGRRGRFTTPRLPDGRHTFTLNAVDNVGNKGRPVTVSWETDSTKPEIQFLANQPKKTKNNPKFKWTSSEFASFECALDDQNYRIRCGTGTNGQWERNNVPKGRHVFSVRGIDSLGNVGEWKSFSFEVDAEGPSISLPNDLPKVTKQNPTFRWTSSEPAKFKCGIDNSFNLVDCGNGTNGQWTGKDIPDGSHVFYVYGVDDLGNRGPLVRHQFQVDNSSPEITFSRLPEQTNSEPRITWTSSENAQFECSLDGTDYKSCGSGLNGVWTRKDVPHGRHVFSVRGKDRNGNVGEPKIFTWNVDAKGPSVNIKEPFPKVTSDQISTIRWTSDETATFKCAVNDVKYAVLCDYGKEGQWVTPRLPDGEHTFYLIPEDTLGNKGPTLSRKWTVDSSRPVIKVKPDVRVHNTPNPSFEWTSSENADFECAIDDPSLYKPCGSGLTGKFSADNVPNGKHVFFVRGKDKVGYGPDVQFPFEVDTQAPSVFLTPIPPKTNQPKVTIRWTSTENSNFECKLDGRSYDCGSGRRGTFTTPDLPDGNHTFSLNTVDSVGNKGKPEVLNWEKDTKPPKVTIKEPFPNRTAVPVLETRWTSDEDAKFKCAVDDVRNSVPCGFGKEGQWVTPRLPDGQHTFYVIPEDDFGNTGPTVSRTWTVDTTAPLLTFSNDLPKTSGKTPTLKWTSSEDAKFECILDEYSFDRTFDCGSGLTGSWAGQNLTDGRHLFWVRAKDHSGNTGPFISHSWTVDESAPRLKFIGVLPRRARKIEPFRWTSNERASFECSLDNGPYKSCGEGITGTWSKAEITSGRHVFRVRGRDKQGNVGVPISHTVVIDTKAPIITLLDPLPRKTKDPTFTFTWSSDEDAKFTCAVNSIQERVDCGQGRNGRFTTSSLPDGKHVFYLLAEDELGNTARVITHRWVVDKTKPEVEFLPNQPKISDSDITILWKTKTNTRASFECALDNINDMKPCGSGNTGSWTKFKIPDGPHTLYVRAKDSFGDPGKVKKFKWRVDTKVPQVRLSGMPPKNSTYTAGSFFWVSDEKATYLCAVDVVESGQPCGRGTKSSWVTPDLTEGEHTFYLFATDTNGNQADPISYRWKIDSKPPIVTMDPNLATTTGSNVTIKWKSNEFATFECAVDFVFDYRDCGSGTDGKLVLKHLPEGYHTIWIKAVDALGNRGPWERHSWFVDSKPPTLLFTSELPKRTNGTASFFWSTGEESVFQCGTDRNNLQDCGKGKTSHFTAKNLRDGKHKFFVKATDKFGNPVTIDHDWIVDTKPPKLEFRGKTPKVSGKRLKLKWRSDEEASFFCAHENIEDMVPCGQGKKSKWLEQDLPEGKHRFWVMGIDDVGNEGKPLGHVWVVDTKGPTLYFDTPIPKKSGREARFSWTSNEKAKFLCALHNPKNFVGCGEGLKSYKTFTDLKRNGEHRLFVKGVDEQGNEGDVIVAKWTVDLEAPVLLEVSKLPRLTNPNPVITWRVNEEATFECALDDMNKRKYCGNGTRGKFIGRNLSKGPHTLHVTVRDPQGNSQPIINHTFVVGIPDNRGRKFVLGFMQQYNQKRAGSVSLFITSDNQTRAEITIPGLQYRETMRLKEDELVRLDLPLSVRMTGSQKEEKGILVTADHELVIYGLNLMAHSTDAFLALPTDIQGTEYYAVSYDVSQHSLIAVVAIEDDTMVYVTLKMTKDIPLLYDGRVYRNGEIVIEELDALGTFQLAHKVDLTGTRITSNKAISVYSGNECANVPTNKGYCDHLVEMLTPTSTWGRSFVTAPLQSRKEGDFFRVVTSKDNTEVTFHPNDKSYLKKAGDFVERDVPSDDFVYITATEPCILMQYSKGADADNTDTDPFLLMIPAIEQYASHYILSTPDRSTKQYFQSYINVIVLTEHERGVLIDGNPAFYSSKFTEIKGTKYSAAAINVTNGVHKVDHTSPIVTFGAFMYGYAWRDSYGYPGGLRLADITGECTGVDTPADGMDNDCDRRIDEELKNGIDDDGDGRIDEDLATFPPDIQLDQTNYEYESCTLEVDALVPRAKAVGSAECEAKAPLRLTFEDHVEERDCMRYVKRTWKASDGCGNVVQLSQSIKITKPKLRVKYPVHVPNGCVGPIDLNVTGGPTIESVCSAERVRVSYRDNISVKECQEKGLLLERRFTVRERCGRVYSGVQRIYPGAAN